MKNMKKILALVLVAMMLVTALAACGGDNPDNSTPGGANSQQPGNSDNAGGTEGTKSFQLYGVYTEEGEFASMMNAAFLLDLNADGTAVADRYNFSIYDDSDAASNPTYIQSYLSGTWKEVEKDGVPCLQIKLAYVDENGNESDNQTCYAYDVAGTYSFDMSFPVVPGAGYSRTVTMSGGEGKTYATDNDFIQAYKAVFEAPEHIGAFVDEAHNGTAYLQADGTLLLYAGYDKFAEGKWNLTDAGITVSVNSEAVEVTMDGSKASFSYSRDMAGYVTDYTFVCDDITALGAPEISEATPYTASIDMGGNPTTAELVLNDDGTAAFKVFTDFECTYKQIGSAVVLSVVGELEGYGAQIWPNVAHAFILNEDHSMLPIVNAYDAGGLALLLMDETTMKVQFPSYGMERDGFSYELSEDGATLTVTGTPDEEAMGAFGQIWNASGAEKYTIDGNTATAA